MITTPKVLNPGHLTLNAQTPKVLHLISSHLISWKKMIEWNSRWLYKTYQTSHLGCEQCLELCSHDPEVSSQSKSQWSLLLQSDKPSCLPFFFGGSLVKFVGFCEFCCLLDESSLLCSSWNRFWASLQIPPEFHWKVIPKTD
jgi:hypothetical protein